MACYRPLAAFVGKKNANGNTSIVWKHADSVRNQRLNLPCGQCIGCRLDRRRDWAFRCMAEASLYPENCFITLTFSNEYLGDGCGVDHVNKCDHCTCLISGSLCICTFQLFMKRLRKRFGVNPDGSKRNIRYFHCGEYGEKRGRPHYHALLFNLNFSDRRVCGKSGEYNLYRSKMLNEVWGKGEVIIGDVSFDSASYVAKYCTKNLVVFKDSFDRRAPMYATMSRRPGIAKGWYEKFKGDVFPADEVIVKGSAFKPPRYFVNQLSDDERSMLKRKRIAKAMRFSFPVVGPGGVESKIESFNPEFFGDRLLVKEVCTESSNPVLERDSQ